MRPRPPPPPPGGPVPSPRGIVNLLSISHSAETLACVYLIGLTTRVTAGRDRSHDHDQSLGRSPGRTVVPGRHHTPARTRRPAELPDRAPGHRPVRQRGTLPGPSRRRPDSHSRGRGSLRSILLRVPSSGPDHAVLFHCLLASCSPPFVSVRSGRLAGGHFRESCRQAQDRFHSGVSSRRNRCRAR